MRLAIGVVVSTVDVGGASKSEGRLGNDSTSLMLAMGVGGSTVEADVLSITLAACGFTSMVTLAVVVDDLVVVVVVAAAVAAVVSFVVVGSSSHSWIVSR